MHEILEMFQELWIFRFSQRWHIYIHIAFWNMTQWSLVEIIRSFRDTDILGAPELPVNFYELHFRHITRKQQIFLPIFLLPFIQYLNNVPFISLTFSPQVFFFHPCYFPFFCTSDDWTLWLTSRRWGGGGGLGTGGCCVGNKWINSVPFADNKPEGVLTFNAISHYSGQISDTVEGSHNSSVSDFPPLSKFTQCV